MKSGTSSSDQVSSSIASTSGADRAIAGTSTDPVMVALVQSTDPQSPDIRTFLSQVDNLARSEGAGLAPRAPIKYLCAQGGGAKGAAYVGTIRAVGETGQLDGIQVVAGASAGAINAFMIGLGLNPDQISRLTNDVSFMDFLDLNDSYLGSALGGYKVVQLGGALSGGYVHTGQNFYQWARAMLQHMTGNADITFSEFHELVKTNPFMKDIVFKAYGYDTKNGQPTGETTFSHMDTPNVRVVDALRASMSFPLAFAPWQVFEKDLVTGRFKPLGFYADGGLACNFPIEVFNQKHYEDPNYPRVLTPSPSSTTAVERNPCSIGLSLCSLEKLDDSITPFTERLQELRQAKGLQSRASSSSSSSAVDADDEMDKKWFHGNIIGAIWHNKIGTSRKEDIADKYQTYCTQTVQIYPEEVSTLEFNVPKDKQNRIENSGYHAWMKWNERFNDPRMTEQSHFKITIDPMRSLPEQYESYFKQFFLEIINESRAKVAYPNADFQQAANNQRLKFYSYQVEMLSRAAAQSHLDVEGLKASAFNSAMRMLADKAEIKREHNQRVDSILDNQYFLQNLKGFLSDRQNDSIDKAKQLFHGKLCNINKIIYSDSTPPSVLALVAASGDVELLQHFLRTLKTNELTFYQQGRMRDYRMYSLSQLVNHPARESIFKHAGNNVAMLQVLLDNRADPLLIDKEGKNAFHYAIDQALLTGDTRAIDLLFAWAGKNNIHVTDIRFGNEQDTLGHYLVKNLGNEEYTWESIQQTLNDQNIVACLNTQVTNNIADTCFDLACHLYHHSAPLIAVMAEKMGKTNSSVEIESAVQRHIANVSHAQVTASFISELMAKKYNIGVVREQTQSLTADECLTLLTSRTHSGVPFVEEAMSDLGLFGVFEILCSKIILDPTKKGELERILTSRDPSKGSALYQAAVSNNSPMVAYLRQYFDADVNTAGPLDNPCALNAAAKAGANESIIALMQTKSLMPGLRGTTAISRVIPDADNRIALHYVAETGTPETFYQLLTNNAWVGVPDKAKNNQLDSTNKGAFYYLLKNRNAGQIIEYLFKYYGKYSLEDFFDIHVKRENGFTDLEWALLVRPELRDILAHHVREESAFKTAIETINRELETPERRSVIEALRDQQLRMFDAAGETNFLVRNGRNLYENNGTEWQLIKALEGRGQVGEAGFYRKPDNTEVLIKEDDPGTCIMEGTAIFARDVLPPGLADSANFASAATMVVSDEPKVVSIQSRVQAFGSDTVQPWDNIVYGKKRKPNELYSAESRNAEQIKAHIAHLDAKPKWQLAAGIFASALVGDESLHVGQFMATVDENKKVTGIKRIDFGARERYANYRHGLLPNPAQYNDPYNASLLYTHGAFATQFGKNYVSYLLAEPSLHKMYTLLWANMDARSQAVLPMIKQRSKNAIIEQFANLPESLREKAIAEVLDTINKAPTNRTNFGNTATYFSGMVHPEPIRLRNTDLNKRIEELAEIVSDLDVKRAQTMMQVAANEYKKGQQFISEYADNDELKAIADFQNRFVASNEFSMDTHREAIRHLDTLSREMDKVISEQPININKIKALTELSNNLLYTLQLNYQFTDQYSSELESQINNYTSQHLNRTSKLSEVVKFLEASKELKNTRMMPSILNAMLRGTEIELNNTIKSLIADCISRNPIPYRVVEELASLQIQLIEVNHPEFINKPHMIYADPAVSLLHLQYKRSQDIRDAAKYSADLSQDPTAEKKHAVISSLVNALIVSYDNPDDPVLSQLTSPILEELKTHRHQSGAVLGAVGLKQTAGELLLETIKQRHDLKARWSADELREFAKNPDLHPLLANQITQYSDDITFYSLNTPDNQGRTALHYLMMSPTQPGIECMKFMLEYSRSKVFSANSVNIHLHDHIEKLSPIDYLPQDVEVAFGVIDQLNSITYRGSSLDDIFPNWKQAFVQKYSSGPHVDSETVSREIDAYIAIIHKHFNDKAGSLMSYVVTQTTMGPEQEAFIFNLKTLQSDLGRYDPSVIRKVLDERIQEFLSLPQGKAEGTKVALRSQRTEIEKLRVERDYVLLREQPRHNASSEPYAPVRAAMSSVPSSSSSTSNSYASSNSGPASSSSSSPSSSEDPPSISRIDVFRFSESAPEPPVRRVDAVPLIPALSRETVNAELDLYITALKKYIDSFKWTSPRPETIDLHAALVKLRNEILSVNPETIRMGMDQLINTLLHSAGNAGTRGVIDPIHTQIEEQRSVSKGYSYRQ